MKPLGLHFDRHEYNTSKCSRSRDRRLADRPDKDTADPEDYPPFCEECNGPCTGLGDFVSEKRSTT